MAYLVGWVERKYTINAGLYHWAQPNKNGFTNWMVVLGYAPSSLHPTYRGSTQSTNVVPRCNSIPKMKINLACEIQLPRV